MADSWDSPPYPPAEGCLPCVRVPRPGGCYAGEGRAWSTYEGMVDLIQVPADFG